MPNLIWISLQNYIPLGNYLGVSKFSINGIHTRVPFGRLRPKSNPVSSFFSWSVTDTVFFRFFFTVSVKIRFFLGWSGRFPVLTRDSLTVSGRFPVLTRDSSTVSGWISVRHYWSEFGFWLVSTGRLAVTVLTHVDYTLYCETDESARDSCGRYIGGL